MADAGPETIVTSGRDVTALADQFERQCTELAGVVHRAADLAAAQATARALIGASTVARWDDERLAGIAERTAPAADAEVSLICGDLAIAETGAIGFTHRTGRSRATGLLPERQVALVDAADLVPDVPAALGQVMRGEHGPPNSFVLAAGPSRTADIEQRIIMGVHAPRTLEVILYGLAPGSPS